jgi:hypothetical protein
MLKNITILCIFLLPALGFADDTLSRSHFSASFSPRWYHVTRDNYASAFSNNGFNSPSKDQAGLGLLAYWTTITNWQLGFGFGGFSASQDLGATAATYGEEHFGFYAAKILSHDADYDITFGTLLGGESSELEVFSASNKGKINEGAAVLEPSIGFDYKVTSWIKLGFNVNYLFSFAESSQVKGDDLGARRISARAVSAGAQVVFGRFE